MATKYLSCAETAKLIRQALKEAFPGIKFSVRSRVYSGGASININWTDGPNSKQVEAVARVFEGSYFDGMTDYKGSLYHMIDGQQVDFGADFIFYDRDYSDAAIQRAIDGLYREYAGNFAQAPDAPRYTVEQYQRGELYNKPVPGMDDNGLGYWTVQQIIRRKLEKMSDRLAVKKSPTAGKVIFLGNDGYSDKAALREVGGHE